MKCDLCGSKKDVRAFYGPIRKVWFKECRECFKEAFAMGCKYARMEPTAAAMEEEWSRGAASMPPKEE